MAKNKEMQGMFAMLKNVSAKKTIPLMHRGTLLRLLGNAVYPDQAKPEYSYLVRLPFDDYGDLTIDNHCVSYLKSVYKTLETEFGFSEHYEEMKAHPDQVDERIYTQYCDWYAIRAVFDFLYIGDYSLCF